MQRVHSDGICVCGVCCARSFYNLIVIGETRLLQLHLVCARKAANINAKADAQENKIHFIKLERNLNLKSRQLEVKISHVGVSTLNLSV
jgi:hypothetical protein